MSGRILNFIEVRDVVVALRKGESMEALAARFDVSPSGIKTMILKQLGLNIKTIRAGVKVSLVLRQAVDLHQLLYCDAGRLLKQHFTQRKEGWLRILLDGLLYKDGVLTDADGQEIQVAFFIERRGPMTSEYRFIAMRLDPWTAVRTGVVDTVGNLSPEFRNLLPRNPVPVQSEHMAGVTSLFGLV
jgi:hypothetical protein